MCLEEEEEEAVFISAVNTNVDPPNAHQVQHRPAEGRGSRPIDRMGVLKCRLLREACWLLRKEPRLYARMDLFDHLT